MSDIASRPLTLSETIGSLTTIAKYSPDCDFIAEEGIPLICTGDEDAHPDKMEQGDVRELWRLGWYWEDKYRCWSRLS